MKPMIKNLLIVALVELYGEKRDKALGKGVKHPSWERVALTTISTKVY